MDAKTIELPPLDVTEEDRETASLIVRDDLSSAADDSCVRTFDRLACRERQLLAALKSLSERDAQLAALQKSMDHATGNEARLLKEVQEAREIIADDVPNIAEWFDRREAWLSRNPSPSVPTKEAQDGRLD